MLSKAATITFKDADGNGHVTIQEAINQINAQASTTKVKASLINGQFVLTQIDNLNADDAAKYDTNGGANTAGEGDTIKYTLAGTGDFAYITGFGSYSTSGQSNTGSMSGQYKSVLTGATTVSANGSEQILGGSITLTGLTADNTVISKTINLSTGTLQNALNTINSAGLGITAKIENNKVTFTSNYFTSLGISVSGDTDFLRVSGLGNYTIGNASSSSASGTDEGLIIMVFPLLMF